MISLHLGIDDDRLKRIANEKLTRWERDLGVEPLTVEDRRKLPDRFVEGDRRIIHARGPSEYLPRIEELELFFRRLLNNE